MRIPKYIRKKLMDISDHANKISEISAEVQEWFEKNGFSDEELRSGNGCSLEEFEYGNGSEKVIDDLEDYLSLLEVDHLFDLSRKD